MRQTKSLVLLAGAALTLSGVHAAQPTGSDETRATVAEMLADAETRSSLLAGADAGHDGKFFIAGEGFRLNVSGQIQFRYLLNFRDDTATDDGFEPGFQTRRTKLYFDGHINENWMFRVNGAFEREGGSFVLEEAWAAYKWPSGLTVRWGQFKLPLLREELVSSSKQLAVERSLANEAFTQDRSQGFELEWKQEDWRIVGAFSDGIDSENTDFTAGESTGFKVNGEADYAFTGRFEYKIDGEWKQFDDFTSKQASPFGALVGVAGHYQVSPNSSAPGDVDRETFEYTADLSLEGDGWNAYGAFIGRHEEFKALGGDTDFDDFGAVIQGGIYVAPNTEIFARWDAIFVDEDRTTDDDNFHFITVGLNQYYAGHAAKGTVDLIWSLNETDELATLSDTGVGLLGDTDDGEITIRFQFQLLF